MREMVGRVSGIAGQANKLLRAHLLERCTR